MILKTQNKIYQVKFGLKGLILLNQFSNNLTDQKEPDLAFLLYCGLCHLPHISFNDIETILAECDLSSLSSPRIPSLLEIQELYTKAVGEIGIAPTDFLLMTPEEIEWAYEGYLRRKETEANLMKIAFMSQDDELIRLTEDKGYTVGNLQEREQVLKMFKREEYDNGL